MRKSKGVRRNFATTLIVTTNQKPASPPMFNLNLILLLLLVQSELAIHCQSTTNTPSATETNSSNIRTALSDRVEDAVTSSPSSSTTTVAPQTASTSTLSLLSSPSVQPATTTATTTGGEVLLSGNEFVDFTETPTILFDGTSNESSASTNDTQPIEAPNGKNTTSSLQVPPVNSTTTTITITTPAPPQTELPKTVEATTTTVPTELLTGPNGTTNATPTTTTNTVEESEEPVGGGLEDEIISGDDETLDDGAREPNVRGETVFEPPKNVSQYMDYIERLFHDLRHQITDLFEPYIPQLIRTSQMVQLSGSCSYDMLRMALALRQFEPWALRMIDSSGKVPEGIFEGSFTALGSYDECLNTVFASSSGSSSGGGSAASSSQASGQSSSSSQQTQGKYCLVNVSPFLPPKPPADKVELMFQEEANRRNYTKDDQFSRLSPMFYYMQFRIGVCIPSSCDESDMDSISSALSSSLRLNITIPHCRVRHTQPITRHQLVGGLVFALVLVMVLGATIMDYWRRKMERLNRRDKIFVLQANGDEKLSIGAESLLPPAAAVLLANCDFSKTSKLKPGPPTLSSSTSFNGRFRQHWSWMSFSLLTNYKLYFAHKQAPCLNDATGGCSSQPALATPVIRCLNGIRVLSLCWVIIANSYITLDPRATKRLTKTRDAPKDFLFQLVAQASLAIETFFFLSGILVSMSFAKKLNPPTASPTKASLARPEMSAAGNDKQEATAGGRAEKMDEQQQQRQPSYLIQWFHFYVHRYIRMTPATMLVIAFTMFAFRYGDGPLWFEATHKAHMSCSENWWRHLLHVANFIDTRQMCFIHYWYIAADMQLFLFAPILMFLVYQRRRIGYAIATLIGLASMGFVFYTTYIRNLPPTLLFYNSDPESRREFGNTIMTKPLTHALPYMVGMLVGKWLLTTTTRGQQNNNSSPLSNHQRRHQHGNRSLATLLGLTATIVALAEVFLPYKWNNSHLPTRFMAALYAAVFRFCWSLVLAYLVIACAHPPGRRCRRQQQKEQLQQKQPVGVYYATKLPSYNLGESRPVSFNNNDDAGKWIPYGQAKVNGSHQIGGPQAPPAAAATNADDSLCLCGSGGNLVNRLLSLNIFTHLSKLSFVAYLIHLPLMSVFIAQTRGLFAFSHMLVIHLALSYLVMTFILSFILVHIIEFPFLTFERYLFQKLFYTTTANNNNKNKNKAPTVGATIKSTEPIRLSQPNLAPSHPKQQSEKIYRKNHVMQSSNSGAHQHQGPPKANEGLYKEAAGGQHGRTMGFNHHNYNIDQSDVMKNHDKRRRRRESHGETVAGNQVDGSTRVQDINIRVGGSPESLKGHQGDGMARETSYQGNDDETFKISERL